MRSWSRTAHRGNGCIGTLESGDRARALRDASYGRDAHEQRLSQTRREGTHGAPRRARRCRRVRRRKQPRRDSNSFVERKKPRRSSPWPRWRLQCRAVGRSYVAEFGHGRDGTSHLTTAYTTTATSALRKAGSSRSASTRLDTSTPLRWAGSAPHAAVANADPPGWVIGLGPSLRLAVESPPTEALRMEH